jgi:hypothetical protein
MHRAVHHRSARVPLLVLTLVVALGAVMCVRAERLARTGAAAAARPAGAAGVATGPASGARR